MLTELYIDALLADEALADVVWALWDAGVITDDMAALAWVNVTFRTLFKEIPHEAGNGL